MDNGADTYTGANFELEKVATAEPKHRTLIGLLKNYFKTVFKMVFEIFLYLSRNI